MRKRDEGRVVRIIRHELKSDCDLVDRRVKKSVILTSLPHLHRIAITNPTSASRKHLIFRDRKKSERENSHPKRPLIHIRRPRREPLALRVRKVRHRDRGRVEPHLAPDVVWEPAGGPAHCEVEDEVEFCW